MDGTEERYTVVMVVEGSEGGYMAVPSGRSTVVDRSSVSGVTFLASVCFRLQVWMILGYLKGGILGASLLFC